MTSTANEHRIGTLLGVDVDGYRGTVHVREDGPADGPPVVLIHGFCGSMRWYDLVVPALTGQFRVLRVDLLGHGATGGPAADAPLQARVVEAVLAARDVTGATVVGHSFGADVAVELAERSDRIDRLIIVCQAPDYSDATLPSAGVLMTLPLVGRALHGFAKGLSIGLAAVVGRVRGGGLPDLAALGLRDFRALDPGMFRVVLVERRDRMAANPLDAQVRASGKPTLVILGGRDHFYGARSAGRYRAAGARVEILPDSGHSPLVEFPDRAAEEIAGFARPAG